MKKLILLFFLLNFCYGQNVKLDNFFNDKTLDLIFSEVYEKKSKNTFNQLNVTKDGLELKGGIRVSKDFGLTEKDNFIFEAEINTEFLKYGEGTGLTIGSILNKGHVNLQTIPFKSLYRYPRNEKFVNLKMIKLDNNIYHFVNDKLDTYGEYRNFGNAFGFLSPMNDGIAYVKKVNLYKIKYFKSDVKLNIHESGISTPDYHLLDTKKLKENQIFQVIISVENYGPFDIHNEKTSITPIGEYDGIKVKIIKYYRELIVGKKEYIHIHFIADENIKKGRATYKFKFSNNNLVDDTHDLNISFETESND